MQQLLPPITDSVEIDGLGDSSPTPLVGLDGSAIPPSEEIPQVGLESRSGKSSIRELAVRSFASAGIRLTNAGGNVIRGNQFSDCGIAIVANEPSSGNIIGVAPPPGEGVSSSAHPSSDLTGACVDPCNRIELQVGSGRFGIVLETDGNIVAGNHLLESPDSVTSSGAGIAISKEGSKNRIGGSRPQDSNLIDTKRRQGIRVNGLDNTIVGNRITSVGGVGVFVRFDARQNTILSNRFNDVSSGSIFLPIDLQDDEADFGVTPSASFNDPGDRDEGANDVQNHPVLTAALDDLTDLMIRGRLESEGAEDYRIQIHRIPEGGCEQEFVREVAEVLVQFSVSTSAGEGDAFFRKFLASSIVSSEEFLAATATDSLNNTSEFSRCIPVHPDLDADGAADGVDPDDRNAGTIGYLNPLDPFTGEQTTKVTLLGHEVTLILVTVFTGGRKGLRFQSGEESVFPSGLAELQIVPEQSDASKTTLGIDEPVVLEWLAPEGLVVDSYYNFGPTEEDPEDHFYEFLFDGETGAEIFEERILLHYVDGGRGDHDLTVNGKILTRGGPVTLAERFYFPQVGDGLVGNIQLQTSLVVQNTRGITPVTLELFNSESGFLTLDLDPLGRGSLFGFGLNPGESVSAQSEGTGDIQAGYAEILAALGVGGTAVFSRSDAASGTLLYEAGVPATQPLTDFTLFVDSLGDRETGLAVAFPTAGQEALDRAELTLRLYDNEFNQLASTNAELLPGQHFARFITQFFAKTPGIEEMQGTVTVSSTEPVVAVTLRQTDDPLRGFPEDVPILTTFPVIPARADLGLAGQGVSETIFFPQIGNGIVADIRLQTELIFVNSSVDEADFTLKFFDSTGGVQAISLTNGETDSRFEFTLGAGEALTLETDGAGPIQVGYARITGPAGLGGTAVFRRSDNPSGTLLYEAGVPASKTLSDFSLVVDNRGARDTGLAVVVPPSTESPAQVTIRLYDTEFNLLAEDTLDLAPGSHLPRFASELFPEVEGLDNLEGTLTVSSTQPITAITIRQNDEPALQFPAEVPTLATFPVIPGRSDGPIPSRR